jgi:putative membrane protein
MKGVFFMRGQRLLIFALIFALIIAIFSVLNVDAVPVNYLFGEALIPLIIVIIASALTGGLIVGAVGIFRQYLLQREVKLLRKTIKNQLGDKALEDIDSKVNKEQEAKHTESNDPIDGKVESLDHEGEPLLEQREYGIEQTQSPEQEKAKQEEEK